VEEAALEEDGLELLVDVDESLELMVDTVEDGALELVVDDGALELVIDDEEITLEVLELLKVLEEDFEDFEVEVAIQEQPLKTFEGDPAHAVVTQDGSFFGAFAAV